MYKCPEAILSQGCVHDFLCLVQVYIFWNYHEPTEGTYDFSDRGNLTDFMIAAGEAGLFVNLRYSFLSPPFFFSLMHDDQPRSVSLPCPP